MSVWWRVIEDGRMVNRDPHPGEEIPEVGADGDFIHGHLKVNYWSDGWEHRVEEQLAIVREHMLTHGRYMRSPDDEDRRDG